MWYSWTAPADGSYSFTTEGSDFDSLLGVYTGTSVDGLTLVGEGYVARSVTPEGEEIMKMALFADAGVRFWASGFSCAGAAASGRCRSQSS